MKILNFSMKLLFCFFIIMSLSKAFSQEIITIKADEARLYFAGMFPSYIFYMQGGIPEDTEAAWVDKEYWAVLEIDPILRRVYCEGLKNVEILTWQLHSVEFKDLGSQLKNEILKTIETEFPNFFELLVLHTYAGYYTDHTIIKLLDLDSVKPQPNGYKLRPFEKTLIAKVSRTSKIWRA